STRNSTDRRRDGRSEGRRPPRGPRGRGAARGGRSSASRARVAKIGEAVIERAHPGADEEAQEEAPGKADEAAYERDAVADEVLTEQRQVRTDHRPPLEDEPVGGCEQHESGEEPGDHARDRRVQADRKR